MKTDKLCEQPNYDPVRFIDWLRVKLNAKNDAALAAILDIRAPQMSKIRHKINPIGPIVIIAVHELTGMPTLEIKKMMFAEAV